MAEAAVETSAARFFCHQCMQEISPVLPDYVCPTCHSGFIEELAQPPQENISEESDDDADPLSPVSDIWNVIHFLRRGEAGNTAQGGQEGANWFRPGPSRRNHRFGRATSRRQGQEFEPSRNPRAEGFLQQFINSLTENTGFVPNASFPVFLNLHGNPGDYAWGRGGWNAIITQLINQLDGTGPPPLPKEKIDEIPNVFIVQDQVDKVLQCTVCMEDFRLGESVRRLSCQHHFHNDCIIPWLELHGTCPICRKILIDESSRDNPFASQSSSSLNNLSQESNSGSMIHRSPNASNSSSTTAAAYSPYYPSAFDFTDECD